MKNGEFLAVERSSSSFARPAPDRRGVILVVVLVVIVLLTLAVYAFSRFMTAERRGANQSLRQKQARLLAESGVEYLRILLMKEQNEILGLGGLYDNPEEFCGHTVTDGGIPMTDRDAGYQTGLQNEVDPMDVGRFSVVSPLLYDNDILIGEGIRYGLEDESCKVNLRWIMQVETQEPGMGRDMLLRLPGVTEEIADSILDWMDDDSESREFGAEDDYYSTLDPPYYTRNGIPDSIDELLLVRGVTPKLLYGIDWNRNGVVDIGEPAESTLEEFDVTDGSLNLGLAAYLTLDSRESTVTPDGLDKINVNMEDIDELRSLLEERFDDQTWVDYIIQYREQLSSGSSASSGSSTVSDILGMQGGGSAAGSSGSGTKINSLLEFVESSTTDSAQAATGGTASPFSGDLDKMNEYLPILYDNLTISDTPLVGRININQAPRTVLELFLARDDSLSEAAMLYAGQVDSTSQQAAALGIGTETSLSETQISDIIEGVLAERIPDPYLIDHEEMRYPFWPYTHGIVEDLETMKKLEPYFCTQGAVFKANVVGRFDERSPVVRLEVWLDAATPGKPARVIRIRELTELGPGYAPEMLGADEYGRMNNE